MRTVVRWSRWRDGENSAVEMKWWWGMKGKVKVTEACRARALNQDNSKETRAVQRLNRLKLIKQREWKRNERPGNNPTFPPFSEHDQRERTTSQKKRRNSLKHLLKSSSGPPRPLFSFLLFSGSPLSLSFTFTPAMGLVAGQPMHNTVQNTHRLEYSKNKRLLCATVCTAKIKIYCIYILKLNQASN